MHLLRARVLRLLDRLPQRPASSPVVDQDPFHVATEAGATARFIIGAAFAVFLVAIRVVLGVSLPLAPLLLILCFEALVNQPWAFLGSLLRSERRLYLLNLTLDVAVIAIAAYVLGGLANRFVGFVFLVAIALVGATGGRAYAYWTASLSSLTYVILALLAARGAGRVVPAALLRANDTNSTLIVSVHAFSFFLLAYFVAIPATRLRRDIVRREQAEAEVLRLNAELEERVVARTAELEAANAELEAFSYSVSHDLRAPLRSLDGFSRIVLEDYAEDLPAEGRRYLQILRQSAQQMGQLVDDLLALSRLGRQALSWQRVAARVIVREALETLRHELEGREVEIVVGELPDCRADSGLLRAEAPAVHTGGRKQDSSPA